MKTQTFYILSIGNVCLCCSQAHFILRIQNRHFKTIVSNKSPNYSQILKLFLLSSLTFAQIWQKFLLCMITSVAATSQIKTLVVVAAIQSCCTAQTHQANLSFQSPATLLAQILIRPTLDEVPGSNFLGTNLD